MDTSSFSVLTATNFFCRLSSKARISSHQFSTKKPPKKHQFVFPKPLTATKASVSSQIHRLSRRRRRSNTLREKILQKNQQVSQNPQLSNNSEVLSNTHDGEIAQLEETDKNSPLWDKLENWVDQLKEDSELWGIGTRPIFTIYQDSDENIVRVSVDEEEIGRRSRVKAWSFEERDGGEEFEDVSSKLARAKQIGKEIEKGEYLMPRNSSLAKFVIEKKMESSTSLVDGLRAISLRHEMVLKALPRIGLAAFCGVCMFWVVAKQFKGEEKVEMTKEEIEMLRRKKEFRMKRERYEKGSVKVLPKVEELPMMSGVRPQLDMDEMMKSIEQARMSRESLVLSDSTGNFGGKSLDFDDKVREIREMARKAREIEQEEHTQNNKQGEGDDLSSILVASKGSIISSDPYVKTKETGSIEDSVSEINSSEAHGKNLKMVGENGKDDVDVIRDRQSSDTFGTSSYMVTGKVVDSLNKMEHAVDIENGKMVGEISKDCTNIILGEPSETSAATDRDIVTGKVVDPCAVNEKKMKHSMDMEKGKLVREDGKDSIHIIPDGGSSKASGTNGAMVSSRVIEHETDTVCFLREAPTKFDTENSADQDTCTTPKTNSLSNKEFREEKERINLKDASSNILSHASNSSQKKPKIIRSVKQAREYLAEKSGVSAHEMQLKQGEHLNAGSCPYDVKPDETVNRAMSENIKVVDSSKLSMSMTYADVGSASFREGPQVNYVSGKQSNEDDTKKVEEKNLQRESNVELPRDIPIGKPEKPLSINVGKHNSNLEDPITDKTLFSSKSLFSDDTDNIDSSTSKLNDLGHARRTENQTWTNSCNWSTSDNKLALENGSSTRDITAMTENGDYCSQDIVTVESADFTLSAASSPKESVSKEDRSHFDASSFFPGGPSISRDLESLLPNGVSHDSDDKHDSRDLPESKMSFQLNSDGSDSLSESSSLEGEKSWLEENFQQLDPIVKKIGDGFRENYTVAKEKVEDQSGISININEFQSLGEDEELEWMKDERLREIVFKVRDNELAGRDPFHLMDADDQHAFFRGLERKAEKVNEKLLGVHEWVHSRIENLDYGTDGISLYDSPEKIVPRWKNPAISRDPQFLSKRAELKVNIDGDVHNSLQKSENSAYSSNIPATPMVNRRISHETSKSRKTLIESSDGSSRPGKKTGKEHWQHTKKWSQGFLEVYNAETDPEIKSILKDMGKDLDRWTTEQDIQDTADLMTKISKRKMRYIEKKMDKLKREVEMYGPQAVVSKYREYSDEKEEDYLWWLDLQFVLCIELYTMEDGVEEVGFYSLEMAAELELNPKQYHVIGFEDPGDSKNFCYIVQAQMDLLGNGRAFVVAQPPKDAFREAKANEFNVTVIKKGEVKLNVDQTLEEVEDKITEIGSKIYHDKIMHERGVDIHTLTKGVVAADKATKRKSKQILTRPSNSRR